MDGNTRFAGDTDDDLLTYMGVDRDVDGRLAADELVRRHREFLFRTLLRALPVSPDEAIDLVQETFVAAWLTAVTYKIHAGTQEEQRRACRKWLVGIARNIHWKAVSRPTNVFAVVEVDACEDLTGDVEVPESADRVRTLAVVEDTISKLSDNQREVLRVTLESHRPGEAFQRLSNDSSAALARSLSTTPGNVRAMRKRAVDKIKAALANMTITAGTKR